jgi:hypothetical protein
MLSSRRYCVVDILSLSFCSNRADMMGWFVRPRLLGDDVKAQRKEILRWIAIIVFGGFGIWTSASGSYHVITHIDNDWFGSLFALGFLALFAAPFYVVAYICLRRHYRALFDVLGAVGAIVVFGVLIELPNHWHVNEFFVRRINESQWFAFLGLPVSLLCLFVPFYGASWFLRYCHRLAQRPTPRSNGPPVTGAFRGG